MTNESASFARRLNRDTSIDSICVKCYQTIATGHSEQDLIACEESHVCDPNCEFNLAHLDSRQSATHGLRRRINLPSPG